LAESVKDGFRSAAGDPVSFSGQWAVEGVGACERHRMTRLVPAWRTPVGMLLDLAKELAIPAVEEELQPYDFSTADEVFIASTSPRVLPVTRMDWRKIDDGILEPVVHRLLAAWGGAVGVDIVKQALEFAPKEQQESKAGS
jgi:hypothetical protein